MGLHMARKPSAARSNRAARRSSDSPPASEAGFTWRGRTPREAANAELHTALVKLLNRISGEFAGVMKPVDLSESQYNVLRILRGAGPQGATCGEVIGRMFRRDPDVTRLLDRLERRALIERRRDTQDRRVVRTRITDAGLALLASLDEPVDAMHHRHLGHLSDRQLGELRKLVESLKP